ncbi:hypothetical protein GCM10027059_26070 [Myceligenerans halotolerans]
MSDDTTTAPISDEASEEMELLLAAIYACAGRLDKDELTDDAGEPLRIIGNEIEDILGLDVQLDQGFLLERGQEYAETGGLGLAHAVDLHIMPTTVVRDRLDDVDLAGVLAAHHTKGVAVEGDRVRRVMCVCGWDTTEDPAQTARDRHIADVVRAALLGEA